ncbi:DUF924 domain-containing protein [Alphaproteobacteria bacterium KMM 3653]|uniref:DUF924 domain-containing protein n=1 Tax=Harenicola maris TaxID=2841044 RepID=A0AAP2CM98_9RHOB|nr:DUF924 domain-containing protein [Harenicola maris]
MQETAQTILSFWTQQIGPEGWYLADEGIDAEISERFGLLWQDALAGRLDHWMRSEERALALLLLTDQFSRNMHRGDGASFATDGLARRVARVCVARDWDLAVQGPVRQFFYLPMMHSEFLSDQEQGVRWFMLRMEGGDNLIHARAHRQVIRDYGRFPYRNAALGRRSTQAELAYLEAGGYRQTLNALQAAG